MKQVFFVTGLPCSGKTYAAKLFTWRVFGSNCTHISTGDIARDLMVTPDLQKQTADKDLFPLEDSLRAELKKQVEASSTDYVIVDGFPRFGEQVDYIVDNFWGYHPSIIEINAGDRTTLVNRARFRSRDGRDNTAEFNTRLGRAEQNMTTVHDRIMRRLCPHYGIMTGDDAALIKQFTKIVKVNK